MEDNQKSIWRRKWTGWGAAFLWFVVLFVALSVFFYGLGLMSAKNNRYDELLKSALVAGAGFAGTGAGLIGFLHWIFCWRNVKRSIFVMVCLVTLVALFYAEEDWRGKRAWDNYVRTCEAAGASMDWKTYVPPQIPDDQNLAMCPLLRPLLDYSQTTNAGVRYASHTIWNDTNGMARVDRLNLRWADRWTVGGISAELSKARDELNAHPFTNGRVNLAAWQNYYRAGTNLDGVAAGKTPGEDVRLALRFLEPDLAELQAESDRRPLARWPVHYETDFAAGILLPHLAYIRNINQTLQLRAAAQLAEGDVTGALADVQLGLRMEDSAAGEPFMISLLVREYALEDILQPVREGIARHQFSEPQLAALQQRLAGEDFFKGYRRAAQVERAMQGEWQHFPGKITMELLRGMSMDQESERNLGMLLKFLPRGWVYQNQLMLCQATDRVCAEAIDDRSHQAFPARATDPEVILKETSGLYSIIMKQVFSYRVVRQAPVGTAWHQELLDQTVLACALERFRLARGEYPETLEALAPQFIAQVPQDVIGGGSLKYQRTNDGRFVLYSIGWNGKDDGGQAVDAGPDGRFTEHYDKYAEGDWVWRYPQK